MQETGQTEKYAYAVLGAGRQGTAAAYDMAKFGNARKVLLGDIDRRVAKQAAKRVNLLSGREVALQCGRVDSDRPSDRDSRPGFVRNYDKIEKAFHLTDRCPSGAIQRVR